MSISVKSGQLTAQNNKFSFSRGVLLAGVALFAMSQSVHAQEQKKEESDAIVLAPIAVDAKADVLTGGVQIDEEQLERNNPFDVRDVFNQQPGVTVSNPTPIGQKVHVNGIEDTKLAVDVDGARQQTKSFHHIGTAIIDPGLLKSVKVETGVAPADAGPEALGGSITYETKDGKDILDPDETFGGSGRLAYNENTNGFTTNLTLASRIDNFDGLAYIRHSNGNSYSNGYGDVVSGTAPKLKSGYVKLGYTADNGYRLKLNVNHTEDRGLRPARPNLGGGNSTDNPAISDYKRMSATVTFGDETPTATWDPKANFSYTRLDLWQELANTGGRGNVTSNITTFNGKASNTFTTDLGKITTGIDFYRDNGVGGREWDADNEETVWNIGGFAQARISLDEKTRLSFGGRVDHNRLKGIDGTKFNDTGLSGNINGEYDFLPWLMGYAGAGTTFAGMPMTEIAIINYWEAFGSQYQWNYDNLKSSRSYNYKIGSVIEEGNFTFDGNVYYTKINNSHDITDNDRGNTKDVVSKGINASAKYNFDHAFVRGTYSFSRVRVDGDFPTSTVAYQGLNMGHTYSLEAVYNIDQYGLRLGTTNDAALEMKDKDGNTLKGYFITNLYGEYRPEQVDGLMVRFDVKNLFDQAYTHRANVGYDNSRYSPYKEPGRTFILTAKYDF